MNASEVMQRNPITVTPATAIADAVHLMVTHAAGPRIARSPAACAYVLASSAGGDFPVSRVTGNRDIQQRGFSHERLCSIAALTTAGGLAMEHRWGFRYLLDMAVRLEGGLPNLRAFARLRNFSSSGAYIETGAAPALDSRVLLELGCRPSPGDSRCRVPAYVVRRDERGVGVEWCEFAPRSVLTLIATVWQADIFEPREDRVASQALSTTLERKPAARANAWPSRSIEPRSTAAHL